ncbi:ectomycorrhiza-induced ankyrin-domain nacht-domain containing protein [Niveomyces insectorum RCEF 264]|uniref:Ectomycorrhiza-induced ankyrin-domain nacht-domain containing protein n=1 Tax=Niveomyces insectorum RCEF 264 TaxID=1081102 RepID=A0A167YTI8_9HYPO|nr:ectomycorrhiza-induced ankyrin-domain nacht-domain containing protein [Niveomyces insectorum RCEF 264]
METLPNELIFMVGTMLARSDLAAFSRTNRTSLERLEPLLYRLHALPTDPARTRSAVLWTTGHAHPDTPETQKMALTTLDKVARFCHLTPGILDGCFTMRYVAALLGSKDWRQLYAIQRWARLRLPHTLYLTPLHVATWNGADDVVLWLLEHGADVDVPIRQTSITALCLAVLRNRISTALLLLAHNADPAAPHIVNAHHVHDTRSAPTVVHLACARGLAELADQCLATKCIHADPTDLLKYYQSDGEADTPAVVAMLLRHGADASDDIFAAFLHSSKWLSAWELLASPTFYGHMTAERAGRILSEVIRVGGRPPGANIETAERMVRRLLDRGADPNLGSLLWRCSSALSYASVLKLLPPFIEAGMVVQRPPPKGTKTKKSTATRRARRPPHGAGQPSSTLSSPCGGTLDLLAETSPYEKDQDDEAAAAQLAIVRLLLQHGAAIGGPTRGDALDAYPGDTAAARHGRAGWAWKLCHVLLEHCRTTPPDQRGEDMDAFLNRFAEVEARSRRCTALLDGL